MHCIRAMEDEAILKSLVVVIAHERMFHNLSLVLIKITFLPDPNVHPGQPPSNFQVNYCWFNVTRESPLPPCLIIS